MSRNNDNEMIARDKGNSSEFTDVYVEKFGGWGDTTSEHRSIRNNESAASFALIALAHAYKNLHGDYDNFLIRYHRNVEDKYSATDGSKIFHTDYPKPFQDICRMAGKQQKVNGAAVDGCTKILGVIFEGIKNNLSKIRDKQAFGLENKTQADFTNFDLLEIGLTGKLESPKGKDKWSPAEIFLRNQNLIEIYSAKYLPSGCDFRTEYLPDQIASKISKMELNPDFLYRNEIVCGKKGSAEPKKIEDTNKYFIEKITDALDEYKKSHGRFYTRQSPESMRLYNALRENLSEEDNESKIQKIVSSLAKNKLDDGRFSKILQKAGFLDENRNAAITPAVDKQQTPQPK